MTPEAMLTREQLDALVIFIEAAAAEAVELRTNEPSGSYTRAARGAMQELYAAFGLETP